MKIFHRRPKIQIVSLVLIYLKILIVKFVHKIRRLKLIFAGANLVMIFFMVYLNVCLLIPLLKIRNDRTMNKIKESRLKKQD